MKNENIMFLLVMLPGIIMIASLLFRTEKGTNNYKIKPHHRGGGFKIQQQYKNTFIISWTSWNDKGYTLYHIGLAGDCHFRVEQYTKSEAELYIKKRGGKIIET